MGRLPGMLACIATFWLTIWLMPFTSKTSRTLTVQGGPKPRPRLLPQQARYLLESGRLFIGWDSFQIISGSQGVTSGFDHIENARQQTEVRRHAS
ncbi:Hypothetical protein NTJ_10765 [Nesidiocoris tenuis]|uniref:Secreted protein n=1 Tax=Nesidiocoris tenuis TaxID=355587 RepID=A0ABN7B438_9HEMI|nr:Hypothetical protein NTJ_10765 [Nesidiocoris tenuis]